MNRACSYLIYIIIFYFVGIPSLWADNKKTAEVYINFSPHYTTPSRTVGNGKWTFQPTAGYTLLDGSVFLNNLSYGINDKFEIGTVPIFYAVKLKDVKILPLTFKVSLIENSNYDLGITLTYIKYNIKFSYSNVNTNAENSGSINNSTSNTTTSSPVNEFNMDSTFQVPQLNFVWRMNEKNQLSINYSHKFYTIRFNNDSSSNPKELSVGNEFFIDYLWSPGNKMHYGMGYSHSYDWLLKSSNGVGLSITHSRQGKFFSSPRIGLHRYNNGLNQLLISTSFY